MATYGIVIYDKNGHTIFDSSIHRMLRYFKHFPNYNVKTANPIGWVNVGEGYRQSNTIFDYRSIFMVAYPQGDNEFGGLFRITTGTISSGGITYAAVYPYVQVASAVLLYGHEVFPTGYCTLDISGI